MAEGQSDTDKVTSTIEPHQLGEEAATNRRTQWALVLFLVLGLVLLATSFSLSLATGRLVAQHVRLSALFSGPGLGNRLGGLGILILAFSPPLAVMVVLGGTVRQRDYRFTLVTVCVLAAMMVAVAAGGAL